PAAFGAFWGLDLRTHRATAIHESGWLLISGGFGGLRGLGAAPSPEPASRGVTVLRVLRRNTSRPCDTGVDPRRNSLKVLVSDSRPTHSGFPSRVTRNTV